MGPNSILLVVVYMEPLGPGATQKVNRPLLETRHGGTENYGWTLWGMFTPYSHRGSGVVITRVISKGTIIITHIRGLISPLIATHEPPSKRRDAPVLGATNYKEI